MAFLRAKKLTACLNVVKISYTSKSLQNVCRARKGVCEAPTGDADHEIITNLPLPTHPDQKHRCMTFLLTRSGRYGPAWTGGSRIHIILSDRWNNGRVGVFLRLLLLVILNRGWMT